MKLNLGGGTNRHDDYLTVDFFLGGTDVRHDLRTPLPYADGSIEALYSSHCIEHFSRAEWEFVVSDWHRVLMPVGKLEIYCPDLEYACGQFIATKGDEKWLRTLYGSQGHDGEYHKNGFTASKLKHDLRRAGFGFVDVKNKGSDLYALAIK